MFGTATVMRTPSMAPASTSFTAKSAAWSSRRAATTFQRFPVLIPDQRHETEAQMIVGEHNGPLRKEETCECPACGSWATDDGELIRCGWCGYNSDIDTDLDEAKRIAEQNSARNMRPDFNGCGLTTTDSFHFL